MEYLDVVNDENEVIDKRPREVVHDKGLPHRTVMFFVRSHDDKILVTKRCENKEFFPGYWSIVLGGHVASGDTYEETVSKEMKEEINTLGEFKRLGEFVKDIEEETEHVNIYEVYVNKEDVKLLDKEFEKGEFWSKQKILGELDKKNFLPETEIVLEYI